MLALLKFIQSLVKTLHSEGTPAQIAAGFALGSALGLTPIANVHNLVVLLLLAVLNVSFGAGMVGWAVFVPVGFLLDPVFDRVGRSLLLDTPSLTTMWTTMYNTPLVPYTNFNNSVVLGSVVSWLALWLPIFIVSRLLVIRYRVTLGEKIQRSQFYRALTASQLYNVYRWFSP